MAAAEAHDVLSARMLVGGAWQPLLLFVIDDVAHQRISTVAPVGGAWPQDAAAQMMIERSAPSVMAATIGSTVSVRLADGAVHQLVVSGIVHDPGLAPAGQERTGYGYITRSSLSSLGQPAVLHELRLRFSDTTKGQARMAASEQTARAVAAALIDDEHEVHQIRVPPPGHPHSRQMSTLLALLLAFAGLALVLSAVLVSSSLAAMLARQVREIGVMKTVGARTSDLVGMYATLVTGIGVVAVAIAVPTSNALARGLAAFVAGMLNFNLTDRAVPVAVFVVVATAGVLVPVLLAAVPIVGASRVSVRAALDQHGVSAGFVANAVTRLPVAVRNVVRRPLRLALTVSLLSAGGATFIASLNVADGWQQNLDKVDLARHDDLELQLHRRLDADGLAAVRAVRGVQAVEAWGSAPAAVARPGLVDVVRTYPDRGHGSLSVIALPPTTQLVDLPVQQGRWLVDDDLPGAVLTQGAVTQFRAAVGDAIAVSVDGNVGHFVVRGIVEEVGVSGVVYIDERAPAAADLTGLLRVQTSARTDDERQEIAAAIEAALLARGTVTTAVTPLSEVVAAVDGHIDVLIQLLLAMAVVMGVVGALALASTMGIAVIERSREFGVMLAIGATPGLLMRRTVVEAVVIALFSGAVATLVAVPLTWGLDVLVGLLGFLAPLPFTFSVSAVALWAAVLLIGAVVATLLPASDIGKDGVRAALAAV